MVTVARIRLKLALAMGSDAAAYLSTRSPRTRQNTVAFQNIHVINELYPTVSDGSTSTLPLEKASGWTTI